MHFRIVDGLLWLCVMDDKNTVLPIVGPFRISKLLMEKIK